MNARTRSCIFPVTEEAQTTDSVSTTETFIGEGYIIEKRFSYRFWEIGGPITRRINRAIKKRQPQSPDEIITQKKRYILNANLCSVQGLIFARTMTESRHRGLTGFRFFPTLWPYVKADLR